MGKNLAYKILESHLVEGRLEAGKEIAIRVDQTLTHDATGTMAYLQFEAMGVPRVRTELSVSYVDHNTLQDGFENADDHRYLQTVAAKHGIHYSKAGNGICHQVHLERFGRPGKTLLGSDTHTPTGGGIGMLAIGAGGLDVALKPGALRLEASDQVARWLVGSYDAKHGGFEAAPKFLVPGLSELAGTRQARMLPALVDPARKTLEKLVASPLWDRRDGGIHRMAAAKDWGAIQYEKMLLVNADLLRELAFALRLGESAELQKALSETASFLTTVIARPGGGFYQAQSADPSSADGGAYWEGPS